MTELPYRPEHVNDAIADTEELTNEELGAYVRLQRAMWRAGGYLPDNSKMLARFARAGKRWGAIAPAIMAKLTAAGGKVSIPDLLAVLLLARERHRRAVEKAKVAAAASVASRRSVGEVSVTSDGGLKRRNPLKTNNVAQLVAQPMPSLGATNQNQNLIESKTLSVRGMGTGRQAKQKQEDNQGLYQKGSAILTRRVGLRSLAARSQISRWLAVIDDADMLANLMAAADSENLNGPHFVRVIDQQVRALERERKYGLALPLGPKAIKSSP